MPQLPESLRASAGRPPLRRVAVVVAAWIVLVGVALLVANALDDPSGQRARDEAQAVAPGTAAGIPTTTTSTAPTAPASPQISLPAFSMVLDHRLPASLVNLTPARQAVVLQGQAMKTKSPRTLVELGSTLQVVGDPASARFAYRSALRFDPAYIPAQVGLAVVRGGEGAAGLADAARRLAALAAANPRSQIVVFNQAWVAIYRRQATQAGAFLARAAALGPQTRLGRQAAALIQAIRKIQLGGSP